MAVIAQREREMIAQRTREALAVARKRLAEQGKVLGNPQWRCCPSQGKGGAIRRL